MIIYCLKGRPPMSLNTSCATEYVPIPCGSDAASGGSSGICASTECAKVGGKSRWPPGQGLARIGVQRLLSPTLGGFELVSGSDC